MKLSKNGPTVRREVPCQGCDPDWAPRINCARCHGTGWVEVPNAKDIQRRSVGYKRILNGVSVLGDYLLAAVLLLILYPHLRDFNLPGSISRLIVFVLAVVGLASVLRAVSNKIETRVRR